MLCFEIFTPEGRGGEKGGSAKFQNKAPRTIYPRINSTPVFGQAAKHPNQGQQNLLCKQNDLLVLVSSCREGSATRHLLPRSNYEREGRRIQKVTALRIPRVFTNWDEEEAVNDLTDLIIHTWPATPKYGFLPSAEP